MPKGRSRFCAQFRKASLIRSPRWGHSGRPWRPPQASSQPPIALAAQSALSVASLAVQCHADVQTLGGTAPVSLYCLTVAKSGERKSATDKLLLTALRDFEKGASRDYEAECLAHKTEAQIWKADYDAALGKSANARIERRHRPTLKPWGLNQSHP